MQQQWLIEVATYIGSLEPEIEDLISECDDLKARLQTREIMEDIAWLNARIHKRLSLLKSLQKANDEVSPV